MTVFLLDASVAAKWVLAPRGESLSAEAVRLLDRYACGEMDFRVPNLFWPEMTKLLWKSVRLGRMTETAANASADWLRDLEIPAAPTKPLLGGAVRLASGTGRTVYDALSLVLAIQTGHTLLTADERLMNAVDKRYPVCWLGALA